MQFETVASRRSIPTLTPLIDIVFLLLVFFMLTAHFVEDQALDITLPEAETANTIENDEITEVLIDQQGNIQINKKPVSMQDMEQVLIKQIQSSSDRSVILHGDKSTQLGLTVKIMDVARKAGASSLDILTEKP